MKKDLERRPLESIPANHPFGKFGSQVSFGSLKGEGGSVWHTGSDCFLWCGSWHHRTPAELHAECKSIIRDLEIAYPSLIEENE